MVILSLLFGIIERLIDRFKKIVTIGTVVELAETHTNGDSSGILEPMGPNRIAVYSLSTLSPAWWP